MPTRLKVPLVFLTTIASILLLPVISLPYGNFDWTAYSHPYQQPGGPPPGGTCTYTVRYGDTLFSIARRFGTSVHRLARANGIRNPNYIFAGQRLVIPNCQQQHAFPGYHPRYSSAHVYIVRRGDTVSGIAYRFGSRSSAIIAANNLRYPWLIFPGQRLVIP